MTTELLWDPDDPRLITAAAESGLAAEYAPDPRLLRHYMRKLLKRGWGGCMTSTERRYTTLARRACGRGMSAERVAAFVARTRPQNRVSPNDYTCTDASSTQEVS